MKFTRLRLTMWAFLAGAFFVLLHMVVPVNALIAILNGIFLGVIVAVGIVYFPLIWFAFKHGKLDRVSQLSIGIALLWLSTAIARGWSFYFRYNGTPDIWRDHWIVSLIAYLAIIGGALFVTAPGYPALAEEEPFVFWGANRKLLLILGAIGGITTFVLSIYPGVRI